MHNVAFEFVTHRLGAGRLGHVLRSKLRASHHTSSSTPRPQLEVTKRPSTLYPAEKLWSSLLCLAYFVSCLLVQSSTGAWNAEYNGYPDEPAHFVGAVMLRDWVASGRLFSPLSFAKEYYDHYPYFAIGYWPPSFSIVTGLAFIMFGVGRMQALLIPAASAALTAWILFRFLRERVGVVAAGCVGAVYLTLPTVRDYTCAVMVDHLTTGASIAAGFLIAAYVRQPSLRNGILSAVVCAFAVLSKYSVAYLVVIPFVAILLFRRFHVLREPSFLIQPIIFALVIGPWALWTKGLSFYGLPAEQAAFTIGRAVMLITATFHIFPTVLMVVIIAGLIALLFHPGTWREDVGVLFLVCAAHLAFLFVSPVLIEPRYVLVPAACVLALSFIGLAAILPGPAEFSLRTPATIAGVFSLGYALLFTLLHYDTNPGQPQYGIRSVVSVVLRNDKWAGQRLVVPGDLEGPFIAEFVAQAHGRTPSYLLRPGKILAHRDWFGGNYTGFFHSPDDMLEYFRKNPVKVIIWHNPVGGPATEHEKVLGDMLQHRPLVWHKSEWFDSAVRGTTSWAAYEYAAAGTALISQEYKRVKFRNARVSDKR